MRIHDVIKRPLITEKAVRGKEFGQYVFEVAKLATKIDVRRAVEQLFKVKVKDVHTVSMHGRRKRVGNHQTMTSDWKKAVVTLRKGEAIELFEGV
ncbi:MAG: 50S ribosomal protein L23 [Deltaproteobacteria bacterium CG11_big_fil_rev_8_21_14_0_20_47_16]|nr:MAG: 50S ribosomal protein L23 [Deltaproteobacteria bacterium CG11_big_fil_rev_8_21_14_0_20_47_16]